MQGRHYKGDSGHLYASLLHPNDFKILPFILPCSEVTPQKSEFQVVSRCRLVHEHRGHTNMCMCIEDIQISCSHLLLIMKGSSLSAGCMGMES